MLKHDVSFCAISSEEVIIGNVLARKLRANIGDEFTLLGSQLPLIPLVQQDYCIAKRQRTTSGTCDEFCYIIFLVKIITLKQNQPNIDVPSNR